MAIQQRASGLLGRAQSLADRVVSPSTRSQFYENVSTFATEHPFLALFLAIQLILSFTPLALFLCFALGLLILSLVTAIIFSLFWIGVALLFLIPTLFVTVSLALGIWVWAVSSLVAARWLYNVLPVNVKGKAEIGIPNGKKIVLDKSGGGYGDVKGEVREDLA